MTNTGRRRHVSSLERLGGRFYDSIRRLEEKAASSKEGGHHRRDVGDPSRVNMLRKFFIAEYTLSRERVAGYQFTAARWRKISLEIWWVVSLNGMPPAKSDGYLGFVRRPNGPMEIPRDAAINVQVKLPIPPKSGDLPICFRTKETRLARRNIL